MDLSQIQADVADAIASAVPNLHVYDYFPMVPELPAAIVVWGTIAYRATWDGTATTTLYARLLSSDVNSKAGQQQAQDWTSTDTDTSIVDAIELVANVAVTKATNEGVQQMPNGGINYLSVRLDIDVLI